MLSKRFREVILEDLSLLIDEPQENKLEFNFDEYASQIVNTVLDKDTPTPFTIGINGEWGSGKTTLIKAAYKKIKNNIEIEKQPNLRVIWFDAWKYEKINITAALLQRIEKEMSNSCKIKKGIKLGSLTTFDIILQYYTKINLNDLQKRYKEIFNEINTFDENIKKKLQNRKLIIFIDDLDRCHTDNILDILESIKNFLSVKNIIFIIAADMSKIERAWILKYNSKESYEEGREYIEKFFQLQLTLPLKSKRDLEVYVNNLINKSPHVDIKWLIKNSPQNPRKIKRMLNLLYFILKNFGSAYNLDEHGERDSEQYFTILVIWIAIALHHPQIVKIAKWSPSYLIQAGVICSNMEFMSRLQREFKRGNTKDPSQLIRNMGIEETIISPDTLQIIEYAVNDNNNGAYKILKHFGDMNDIHKKKGITKETLNQIYADLLEPLKHIINKAGMIG